MKIAVVLAAVVTGAAGFAAIQERETVPVDRTRFLFAAVVEGLAEDGFDPKLAGEIGDNARLWFIKSCPICESVLLAFKAYKASCDGWRMKSEPWNGSRVPKETMEQLRHADTATRHKAFEGLVSKYVEARFERVKMTEETRIRMRESIKIGMGEGLKMLKQSGSAELFPASCPSCEGAN
ncbi:MAG TPA: hypothetical protein VFS19_04040 [Planctomycetota bacterium]|nr:hypothetical protein [Planctomycetota bacterium]